jgi:hypothetical protein
MCRFFRFVTYLAALIQFGSSIFILVNGHNAQHALLALALMALPALTAFMLYTGPSLKELRLSRQLNCARMEDELATLEKKNDQKAK